ncbi:hypothetical protein GCM10028778_13550 [Barrientosiimonas marina]|uniref:Cytochrome c oxidase assembly protein n=1 Tax=Lentibacillus kimchii TaxID=1542911 RepID=A0ABW2UR14_9BACI
MHHVLANHAWYELTGPVTLVVTGLLCYWYISKMIRSPHVSATYTQRMYFFLAISLFFLVKGTPFAVIADHYLFSALLSQLSFMAFVIMPLFILSLPEQYVAAFFWNHRRAEAARLILNHPWFLAIMFNVLISIYLIPPVFSVIHESTSLQLLFEVLFMSLAFLTWWVIIQPLTAVAGHSYFKRIVLVFFMAMFLMPAGFYLLVAQEPMYGTYATASSALLPVLTAVYDQQAAGGVLKILQLTSYAFALYYLLKRWGLREEKDEGNVNDDTRVVQGVVIQLNEYNQQKKGRKR